MRVLVATKETQGSDRDDYAFTVEGELVMAEVSECASPEHCGCGRGFPGLASRKATTTAMIADLAHVTEADLRQAITDWLDGSGWTDLFRSASNVDDDDDDEFIGDFDDIDSMIDSMVDEHIEVITEICEAFPVGTIVERSGTRVRARSIPFAA
jgi:hypothetical protein